MTDTKHAQHTTHNIPQPPTHAHKNISTTTTTTTTCPVVPPEHTQHARPCTTNNRHTTCNTQHTNKLQHTTYNKHMEGPAHLAVSCVDLGTRELYKRQRSVQMRLEVMNSFACPMVLMVVARRSNRCEAPIRCWTHAACIALLSLYTCTQFVPFHSAVVEGGNWRIGSSSLRPELPSGLHCQDREFEQGLLQVSRSQNTNPSARKPHTWEDLLPSRACMYTPKRRRGAPPARVGRSSRPARALGEVATMSAAWKTWEKTSAHTHFAGETMDPERKHKLHLVLEAVNGKCPG